MKTDETDFPEDICELAREHTEDAIAVLAEIMADTDAPAGARVSAAKALLERGWGKAGTKPPDDGNRAVPITRIERVIIDPKRPGEEISYGSDLASAKRPSEMSAKLKCNSPRPVARRAAQKIACERAIPVPNLGGNRCHRLFRVDSPPVRAKA